MIHLASFLSVLSVLMSHAQSVDCQLKDEESLDEKQVFFQLRSEVSDSKDHSAAAHPRWRWRRRNRRYKPYHPYGPRTATIITTSTSTSTTTSTSTSTTTSTTTSSTTSTSTSTTTSTSTSTTTSTTTSSTTSTSTSTTTSTTTSITIPVCTPNLDVGRSDFANETRVDIPAGVPTPVLVNVDNAGCCVLKDFDLTGPVGVAVSFDGIQTRQGNLTVSLESPRMQLVEVGNISSSELPFLGVSVIISEGEEIQGVWKVIVEATQDASGWTAVFSQLTIFVEQCI